MESTVTFEATVKQLIEREQVKIPPYPAIAMRINHLVNTPDYGLKELTGLVASDPVLVAEVIRYANSAFFQSPSKVTSLSVAVTRIGAQELARIVLAITLGAQSRTPGALTDLKIQHWRQSLTSAMFCQAMAPRRNLPTEEAFICGLLHDFGEMVAIECLETIISRQKNMQPRPAEFWTKIVQKYHILAGEFIAKKWKLPKLYEDVIIHHHDFQTEDSSHLPYLKLVALANEIVHLLNNNAHVSTDLFASNPLIVDENDVQFIALIIPQLSPKVAAIESAHDLSACRLSGNPQCSMVASPPPQPPEGPAVTTFFTVAGVTKSGLQEYHGIFISPTRLGIRGKTAVEINSLMRFVITHAGKKIEFWATVLSCVAAQGEFSIEVKPYGLSSDAKKQWQRIMDYEQA